MNQEQFETIMAKLNEISMAILAMGMVEIKYSYGGDYKNEPICTCPLHRGGQYTTGWNCPVHGQSF